MKPLKPPISGCLLWSPRLNLSHSWVPGPRDSELPGDMSVWTEKGGKRGAFSSFLSCRLCAPCGQEPPAHRTPLVGSGGLGAVGRGPVILGGLWSVWSWGDPHACMRPPLSIQDTSSSLTGSVRKRRKEDKYSCFHLLDTRQT